MPYLEFNLPNGTIITEQSIEQLTAELLAWSEANSITLVNHSYVKGAVKYRVELKNDFDYTIFSLSWDPVLPWMRGWELKEADA